MKHLVLLTLLAIAGFVQAQTTREPLFTSFDGTQLHYDVLGKDKPVVLLHGFITNGESWKRAPVRQALAEPGSRPELQSAVDYAKKSGADTIALARMQEFQPTTSRPELGELRVPLLVVNGDKDLDNGNPQELVDAVPGARLVIVPGTHGGAMSTPEFAKAVGDFLKE